MNHRRTQLTLLLACLLARGLNAFAQTAPSPCAELKTLKLPDTTITLAESVAAGTFRVPAGTGRAQTPPPDILAALPEFCRVAATLTPTKDSDIKIEVWMPASGWNGKFQAVGNGGWSGAITYQNLSRALAHGFATASTDTGHSGGNAEFALGHPEKLIDFAYRAVHEMTVNAKAIIASYYRSGPRYSYWNGCSSGGKQGLKEAQRFPNDFDGIIAGAPANNWTHLMTGELWIALAVHKDESSFIPEAKYPLIHKAVLEACDALDGLKDGVLEDPTRCHFDPSRLLCKGGDSPNCLTSPQVEAVRKIYSPATNPRTGREIYPGLEPGSEMLWRRIAGAEPFDIPVSHYRYVVFQDPKWDWHRLNFDRDVALADKIDNGAINATDPNLKPFLQHGGKLLLYHGWSDDLIAPQNSVNYYKSVLDTLGGGAGATDSVRLFMVPGMGHCGGGDGTRDFDMVPVIEQWVENGKPPQRIEASRAYKGKVNRTRPLCPYPQVAKYKGSGSTDEAANFVCRIP